VRTFFGQGESQLLWAAPWSFFKGFEVRLGGKKMKIMILTVQF